MWYLFDGYIALIYTVSMWSCHFLIFFLSFFFMVYSILCQKNNLM